MHQVAYLRNSIAHPPKPSLAEAVAGLAAMVEVLKDHGQPIQDMLGLLDTLREASWRGGGELLAAGCWDSFFSLRPLTIRLRALLNQWSTCASVSPLVRANMRFSSSDG